MSRPLHPCAVTTCATLTDKPRCPIHTTERYKDPAQAKHYGSVQWKVLRGIVKRRDPICAHCHRKPSTQAHHKDNNWKNNDLSNLEGICKDCHLELSGAEHHKKIGS